MVGLHGPWCNPASSRRMQDVIENLITKQGYKNHTNVSLLHPKILVIIVTIAMIMTQSQCQRSSSSTSYNYSIKGREINAYERIFHSSNMKAAKWYISRCLLLIAFTLLNLQISLLDPKLVISMSLEMKQSPIQRGASFYVGWMIDMLVCDNSLSPK